MGKSKKSTLANAIMDELLNDEVTLDLVVESPDDTAKTSELEATTASPMEMEKSESTKPVPVDPDPTDQIATPPQLALIEEDEEEAEQTPIEPPMPEPRAEHTRSMENARPTGMASSTDHALAQSETLRVAQQRILELEKELDRLRQQNEELGSAGETLRRRSDELLSENEELRRRVEHEVSTSSQEKEILRNSKDQLRREVEELRQKNSELEIRLSNNLQRVRVRERELENRLELVKAESRALVRSKDEMVLDLKRQIDQLNLELNNYRIKSQDLNKQITERQEMMRRTVKALRLALSMLEGEEEVPPLKKVK